MRAALGGVILQRGLPSTCSCGRLSLRVICIRQRAPLDTCVAHSVTFAALCEFIVANSSLFRRLPAIFVTVLSLLFCYVAPGARISSGASTPLTGGSTMLPGKKLGK